MSYLARMLILRYSITHVRAKVTAYLRFHAHKSRPHLTIAGGQCEVVGLLALCFFDLRQGSAVVGTEVGAICWRLGAVGGGFAKHARGKIPKAYFGIPFGRTRAEF